MPSITPRQAVLAALRGGHTEKVPFTIYESKIPQCSVERDLRNRGLCIVQRGIPVVKTHTPNVQVREQIEYHDGKKCIRTFYQTPVGTLTTLLEPAGFTSWWHEKMFKSPDDYKALLFLIQDERYEADYAPFARAEQYYGEDFILRAGFGLEPLQLLISAHVIAMEDFCMQWMENRDEILKLYKAIVEKRRQLYPLIAQSPASHANYGGNVVVEVIGVEGFKEYYVPHYNEAAEVMHKHGKFIGSHLDGNCKALAPLVAGTDLDYIEAFTPAPDTDMTLAEARAAWPDKALWLNFPSSQHLRSDEDVEKITQDLLDQAGRPDGIIMGITEDIPEHRWQNSCQAIMTGLEAHARNHPRLYCWECFVESRHRGND